jgi:hypothetical protein
MSDDVTRELSELIRDLGTLTDRAAGVYEASLYAALLDRVLAFMEATQE